MLTYTLSMGIPACLAVDSMIRMLAWCGNQQIDLIGRESRAGEGLVAGIGHRLDGGLEHFPPRHLDEVAPLAQHLFTGRSVATATRPEQQVTQPPVRLEIAGKNAAAAVPRRPD